MDDLEYQVVEDKKSWLNQDNWQKLAWLKIGVVALLIAVGTILIAWQQKQAQINQIGISSFNRLLKQSVDNNDVIVIPYQQTLYKHFGNAINPQVKLNIKTTNGYKETEFLLDSGAVVSALPKIAALDLGVELDALPRITIEGFAGQKTFAYQGEFVVHLANNDVVLPVVFSENPQASNILGRIGFFDQFNIVFNAENKNISISRRAI